MLLTIAIVGAAVLLVTVGIAAAAHDPHPLDAQRAQPRAPHVLDQTGPSRFFVDQPVQATEVDVPVALLLERLEQHIRYEEAAVEAFLHTPERETLYSETSSNWVN